MAPGKKKKSKEARSKDASNKDRARLNLAGSGGKEQQQEAKVQVNSCSEAQPLADEVPYIRACWDVLTEQERQEIFTVDVEELQETALEISTHTLFKTMEHVMPVCQRVRTSEVLMPGMEHLYACRTSESGLKRWRWPQEHHEFVEAGPFRAYVEANHIDQELLEFLPKGNATAAEADALWIRMAGLLERVCTIENTYRGAGQGEHSLLRSMELITTILAAFEEHEHVYLYQFVLFPVITAVFQSLPTSERSSTAANLSYCDLEKLPLHVLLHICNWLTAGVRTFSKFKSESIGGGNWLDKEGNTIAMARGRDKYCLAPHDTCLVQLDPSWYKYLKELELVREDTNNIDVRLQWVLGHMYDHDSYQGWSQIGVGKWVPTVQWAHQRLVGTLHDMKAWQTRAENSKQLLQEMLVSRRALAEIKLKHDVSSRPDRETHMHPCELPDHVVIALLRREALLVMVRVHTLKIQHLMDKDHLRHLQAKQSQGEPEFKRWDAALKAEHAELQSGRSGAKAHLDLVTDESGVAEKFESLGATLQAYEAEEREMRRHIKYHATEIKEALGWSGTCMQMADSLKTVVAAREGLLADGLQEGAICPGCNSSSCISVAAGRKMGLQMREEQAEQLRDTAATLKQAFQTEVRHQLHDEADEQRLYKLAQKQLKQIEKQQKQGQAVLPLLENSVIHLACDDPGADIGPHLILPTLKKKLLARAHEFHQAEKTTQQEAAALLASQELLAEEEQEQARRAAKKAKQDQAKAKSGGKPAASQSSIEQEPPLQPDSHVRSPSAHALHKAEHQHKYDELFTSSPSAGDRSLVDQLAASATSAPELDPINTSTSTSTSTTSVGPTHEAGQQTKKGSCSVVTAHAAERPAMATESVVLEPCMPNESSSLATESSGLAAESPSLAAESSSSFSCSGSHVLEQTVFHLMMCPLTQAVMRDPVIAADGHTYERAAMQKWLHQHQSSPTTGEALTHVRLVPNVLIRSVIQQQLL